MDTLRKEYMKQQNYPILLGAIVILSFLVAFHTFAVESVQLPQPDSILKTAPTTEAAKTGVAVTQEQLSAMAEARQLDTCLARYGLIPYATDREQVAAVEDFVNDPYCCDLDPNVSDEDRLNCLEEKREKLISLKEWLPPLCNKAMEIFDLCGNDKMIMFSGGQDLQTQVMGEESLSQRIKRVAGENRSQISKIWSTLNDCIITYIDQVVPNCSSYLNCYRNRVNSRQSYIDILTAQILLDGQVHSNKLSDFTDYKQSLIDNCTTWSSPIGYAPLSLQCSFAVLSQPADPSCELLVTSTPTDATLPASSGTQPIIQCFSEIGLGEYTADDGEAIEVVSGVIEDPFCCETSNRADCLESKNIEIRSFYRWMQQIVSRTNFFSAICPSMASSFAETDCQDASPRANKSTQKNIYRFAPSNQYHSDNLREVYNESPQEKINRFALSNQCHLDNLRKAYLDAIMGRVQEVQDCVPMIRSCIYTRRQGLQSYIQQLFNHIAAVRSCYINTESAWHNHVTDIVNNCTQWFNPQEVGSAPLVGLYNSMPPPQMADMTCH